MDKLSCIFLTARRFSFSHSSSSFSTKCFSTLAKHQITNLDLHYTTNPPQNLFADFASKKFKLPSTDIARMLRTCPLLKKLKTLEKAEQVIDMLKRYGCSNQQIALIMKRQPKILVLSAERTMEPKLRLLKGFGIRGEGLATMLALRPNVLTISLQHSLLPIMRFLEKIFVAKKSLVKALLRNPYVLVQNLEKTLKPSVAFWEEFGFKGKELAKLLVKSPGLLLCTSWTSHKAELIRRIGIERGSKMYVYVLIVVATARVETLEGKIKNFRECGLTVEETMELFRISPFAFGLSKERVKQSMDFIVNHMEFPANTVVKYPVFLKKSLEKSLNPRFLVWQKLKSLGGNNNTSVKPFHTILAMSEEIFVSKIVMRHIDSAILYGIYQGALAEGSSPTDISNNA